MTIIATVLSDRPDEYTGKKGLVKSQVLNLLDVEPGENRCSTILEYTLSEAEKTEHAGKLQDKRVKFGIREFASFGNRIRVRGKIVEVLK